MEPFSVRMGIIRANESVQTHDMDDRLRNGLWTAFVTFFARGAQLTDSRSASYPDVEIWLRLLWTEFFGLTVDSMDVNDKRTLDSIRYQYKELPWFKVTTSSS